MGDQPKDYEIGRGRPPKKTQWAKGQCGNPRRIYKRHPRRVIKLVDDFFAGEIDIVENGISRRVSAFEAIVLQLCIKATAGNKRAVSALLKFQNYAKIRGGMPPFEIVWEKEKAESPPPKSLKEGV